jgi:hypothetical protein
MNDWISVKDALPEIDYDKKKPSVKVRIKINNNEDFCLDCLYRQVFSLGENGQPDRAGYVFYTMGGKAYIATHWMYAAKKKKRRETFTKRRTKVSQENISEMKVEILKTVLTCDEKTLEVIKHSLEEG